MSASAAVSGRILLAVIALSCSSACRPPTRASGPPLIPTPVPDPPARSLSGTVFELLPGARVPTPNASVLIVVWESSGSGHVAHYRSTATDARGEYTVTGLPAGFTVVHARRDAAQNQSETRQVCAAATQTSAGTAHLDVEITSAINPQPSPTMPPIVVSGRVFETVDDGVRGLEASIYLEWFLDAPLVGTRSGADGRYHLCGLPARWPLAFSVTRPGYASVYSVARFESNATLDFEMKR